MVEIFRQYIASPEWQHVRDEVIRRDNYKCVECGEEYSTKGSVVHHKDYDNWGSGDIYEIMDCILLCKKCHTKAHAVMNNVPFWAKRYPDIWVGPLTGCESGALAEMIS